MPRSISCPPGHFSLGISLFGTMLFTDPVAAFANIAQALCSGARLVQLVWQASDRQERHRGPGRRATETDLRRSLLAGRSARTAGVLTAAGFTAVDIPEVREPIYYGPDADSALDAVRGLQTAAHRGDLHVLVEAPDGTMASSTIMWPRRSRLGAVVAVDGGIEAHWTDDAGAKHTQQLRTEPQVVQHVARHQAGGLRFHDLRQSNG